MNMLKEFWKEEDGFAVVELLLILAVLIIIALLFKDAIVKWVTETLENIFPSVKDNSNTTI
ncbi:MAG: holin, BlyA family protein [Lachnospiraceae bacterium]|nr:holin, BlyA family protein [Lachnospiraceae bacterium]